MCFEGGEKSPNGQMEYSKKVFICCLSFSLSLGLTEVQERQECQYGENCTFAYCQEEIDVWTQERKGALSRELLFDPLGSTERRALSVTRLLQLHMGMFMFLCEVRPQSVCFFRPALLRQDFGLSASFPLTTGMF